MYDVYLFRHSHMDYGPGGASAPDSPLTPLGHQMAARLAERCPAWDLQYLFVSTMLRAQQTADAISARLPVLPRLDIDDLAEIRLEDLQGFPGELPIEDVLTWKREHLRYANSRQGVRVAAAWARVRQIIEEQGLQRVAILAHGGTLNALLRLWQGQDVSDWGSVFFQFDWTGTGCVRFEPGICWVRWLNDARHIDDLRPLMKGSTAW